MKTKFLDQYRIEILDGSCYFRYGIKAALLLIWDFGPRQIKSLDNLTTGKSYNIERLMNFGVWK